MPWEGHDPDSGHNQARNHMLVQLYAIHCTGQMPTAHARNTGQNSRKVRKALRALRHIQVPHDVMQEVWQGQDLQAINKHAFDQFFSFRHSHLLSPDFDFPRGYIFL